MRRFRSGRTHWGSLVELPDSPTIGDTWDKPGKGYRAPSLRVRLARATGRTWAQLWRWILRT